MSSALQHIYDGLKSDSGLAVVMTDHSYIRITDKPIRANHPNKHEIWRYFIWSDGQHVIVQNAQTARAAILDLSDPHLLHRIKHQISAWVKESSKGGRL